MGQATPLASGRAPLPSHADGASSAVYGCVASFKHPLAYTPAPHAFTRPCGCPAFGRRERSQTLNAATDTGAETARGVQRSTPLALAQWRARTGCSTTDAQKD